MISTALAQHTIEKFWFHSKSFGLRLGGQLGNESGLVQGHASTRILFLC
jgi:hypothetical protein